MVRFCRSISVICRSMALKQGAARETRQIATIPKKKPTSMQFQLLQRGEDKGLTRTAACVPRGIYAFDFLSSALDEHVITIDLTPSFSNSFCLHRDFGENRIFLRSGYVAQCMDRYLRLQGPDNSDMQRCFFSVLPGPFFFLALPIPFSISLLLFPFRFSVCIARIIVLPVVFSFVVVVVAAAVVNRLPLLGPLDADDRAGPAGLADLSFCVFPRSGGGRGSRGGEGVSIVFWTVRISWFHERQGRGE